MSLLLLDDRQPAAAPPPAAAPAAPPHAQQLRALVDHAVRAPSGHNAQPWLFRIVGDALELRADRTRALPVVDPDDRELVIGCGAALAFLRVAARAVGHRPVVQRLPRADDPDLLARVRLDHGPPPTQHEIALFAAIARRRTNRRAFEDRDVPEPVLALLEDVASAEGVWLRRVTTPGEQRAVAGLVAEGDRQQAADPAFRRELAAWLHPNRSRSRDGMPGAAFGVHDLASLAMPWAIRTFDWGDGQAARDRELALGSPALVVLGSTADTPAAWLRTGEALGMLLLHACLEGISASFLNQPIEVAALRPALAAVLGVPGYPQLLLRLGYGPDVPATPRRDVEEVMVEG